ncbi:hypothetical protein BEN74_04515 [Acinetobacter sp. WCHAc010034]|nr:hypothetical protein BEN74_04515 [Acinetobacter sp. WCHAc010034]
MRRCTARPALQSELRAILIRFPGLPAAGKKLFRRFKILHFRWHAAAWLQAFLPALGRKKPIRRRIAAAAIYERISGIANREIKAIKLPDNAHK